MTKFNRRKFIKSILKLSILSLIPINLRAFSFLQEGCLTTPDIQGPFYIENPPNISILTPPKITSDFFFITGTVYAKNCKTPIPNAVVDIWHANKGMYDETSNTFLNSDYENNYYRGKVFTDSNGNYAFQTIMPGKYLNGLTYRPSHIHYKSSYLNQNEITTQLYFEGDSSIETDPWASDPSANDRIVTTQIDENNNTHAIFNIYLDVNENDINSSSLTEEKNINNIFPNPINSNSIIELNKPNCIIEICDINGKTITKKRVINKQIKFHEITKNKLSNGIYILRTKNILDDIFESKRFVVNNY